jgi:4-diphosphocytidyl-2-C-methyl-D-erythritol kinase
VRRSRWAPQHRTEDPPTEDPYRGDALTARRPPSRVVVRVPAKINLCLCVGPLRDDGYHDLQTVFSAVALFDEVEVAAAERLTVAVSGEGAAEVPTDTGNLAARAVELLARATGAPSEVAVTLRKGIPVAGGMAGGSADGAAALLACDALWGTGLTRDELSGLAARLGSDVPFALHGGTALGTGRGERLTPVLDAGSWHWVLALAEGGLSTPAVYGELDRRRATGPVTVASEPGPVLQAVRSGDPRQLGAALSNDLQPAALALRPGLRRVLDAGLELGALGGLVSGSGPSVAFLAADADAAAGLAAALAGQGVCRTVRCATGPALGARVVERD